MIFLEALTKAVSENGLVTFPVTLTRARMHKQYWIEYQRLQY